MRRRVSATCWAVLWRRTNRSKALRSTSVKLNGSGFGPRMTGSSSFPDSRPSILQNYFRLNVLALSGKASKRLEFSDDIEAKEGYFKERNPMVPLCAGLVSESG